MCLRSFLKCFPALKSYILIRILISNANYKSSKVGSRLQDSFADFAQQLTQSVFIILQIYSDIYEMWIQINSYIQYIFMLHLIPYILLICEW